MSTKNGGVVVSKAAKVEESKRLATIKAGNKNLKAIVKNHDAARNGKGNGKNGNGKPAGKPVVVKPNGKVNAAVAPKLVKPRATIAYTVVGETRLLTRAVATLKKLDLLAKGKKDGLVWVKDLHDAMGKDGADSKAVGAATYHLTGKELVGWMHRDVEDANKRWAYSFFLTAEGKKVLADLK
jgi:hypothetical protein